MRLHGQGSQGQAQQHPQQRAQHGGQRRTSQRDSCGDSEGSVRPLGDHPAAGAEGTAEPPARTSPSRSALPGAGLPATSLPSSLQATSVIPGGPQDRGLQGVEEQRQSERLPSSQRTHPSQAGPEPRSGTACSLPAAPQPSWRHTAAAAAAATPSSTVPLAQTGPHAPSCSSSRIPRQPPPSARSARSAATGRGAHGSAPPAAPPRQRPPRAHLSTPPPLRRRRRSRAAPGSPRAPPPSPRSPRRPPTASRDRSRSARGRAPPGPSRSAAGGRRRRRPAGSTRPGTRSSRRRRRTPPPCRRSARGRPPASAAGRLHGRAASGPGGDARRPRPFPGRPPEQLTVSAEGPRPTPGESHRARDSSPPSHRSSARPGPTAGAAYAFSGTPQPSCRHATAAVPLSRDPADTPLQTPGRRATSRRPSHRLSPPRSRRDSAAPEQMTAAARAGSQAGSPSTAAGHSPGCRSFPTQPRRSRLSGPFPAPKRPPG